MLQTINQHKFLLSAHLAEDVVRGARLAQPVVTVLRRPRPVGVAPVELVHPGHLGGEKIWGRHTRFYNTDCNICVDIFCVCNDSNNNVLPPSHSHQIPSAGAHCNISACRDPGPSIINTHTSFLSFRPNQLIDRASIIHAQNLQKAALDPDPDIATILSCSGLRSQQYWLSSPQCRGWISRFQSRLICLIWCG